jgi:hypothetical protein
MTRQLILALMMALLAVMVSCADDSKDGGSGGDSDSDSDSDTGEEDTDSWIDEYSMPFDVEPFQWANVPGGLEAPTAETFAGRVLLILFFQKW